MYITATKLTAAALVIAGMVASSSAHAASQAAGSPTKIGIQGLPLSEEDQAVLKKKCGGGWDIAHIKLKGGVIACSNGEVVDDEEVRAISRKLMERLKSAG